MIARTRNDPNNFHFPSLETRVGIIASTRNHVSSKETGFNNNNNNDDDDKNCTQTHIHTRKHVDPSPRASIIAAHLLTPWIRVLRTFHGTWIRGWQSGPILFHRSEIEGGGRAGKVSIALWCDLVLLGVPCVNLSQRAFLISRYFVARDIYRPRRTLAITLPSPCPSAATR